MLDAIKSFGLLFLFLKFVCLFPITYILSSVNIFPQFHKYESWLSIFLPQCKSSTNHCNPLNIHMHTFIKFCELLNFKSYIKVYILITIYTFKYGLLNATLFEILRCKYYFDSFFNWNFKKNSRLCQGFVLIYHYQYHY